MQPTVCLAACLPVAFFNSQIVLVLPRIKGQTSACLHLHGVSNRWRPTWAPLGTAQCWGVLHYRKLFTPPLVMGTCISFTTAISSGLLDFAAVGISEYHGSLWFLTSIVLSEIHLPPRRIQANPPCLSGVSLLWLLLQSSLDFVPCSSRHFDFQLFPSYFL